MNVVLVAEEAAGVHALRLLAAREESLLAVFSGGLPERGKGVPSHAAELGLELLDSALVTDRGTAEWLREREVDLLVNVHSILNPDPAVLAVPRIGAFNMHPGPLPTYAGFNAPSWAIAAGETRHAVTVHRMVAEMDAGPIAYESWFEIGPEDTGLRVAAAGVKAGLPLLERLLDDAARGEIPAREQSREGARFFGFEVPHEGRLPWGLGAKRVADLVRAADYAPFESPWGAFATTVEGAEVEVLRATATGESSDVAPGAVGPPREGAALVSAGDEWVAVERCRRDGAPAEPAQALPAGAVCD
ncbi:MAG: formyltransferase family protein [Nocardioides sp.]